VLKWFIINNDAKVYRDEDSKKLFYCNMFLLREIGKKLTEIEFDK
jgi:hypothetical protein